MSGLTALQDAFRDSLGLTDHVHFESLAYGKTPEWDSVAHMQMVAALERAFDIMIETDHVIAMADYSIVKAILSTNYDVKFDA